MYLRSGLSKYTLLRTLLWLLTSIPLSCLLESVFLSLASALPPGEDRAWKAEMLWTLPISPSPPSLLRLATPHFGLAPLLFCDALEEWYFYSVSEGPSVCSNVSRCGHDQILSAQQL